LTIFPITISAFWSELQKYAITAIYEGLTPSNTQQVFYFHFITPHIWCPDLEIRLANLGVFSFRI
jgi:hypothetical protein